MKTTALYIHIPYCSTKCKYCSFSVLTDQKQKSTYLSILIEEISARVNKETAIRTIYFGGGTPSILSLEEVGNILSAIQSHGNLSPLEEISFEVNPENVSDTYIQGLQALGITRISMGIQTLNDKTLNIAGRHHTVEQALSAMKVLQRNHLSWNADLILGLPQQEPKETLEHAKTILRYRPTHISVYFLSIEQGTEFSLLKKTVFPKEKEVIETHSQLVQFLQQNSYRQYEISNWALPEHESKHNLMYWKGQEYIGVGLGASSYVDNTISNNYKNLQLYIREQRKQEPRSVQRLEQLDIWYLELMTGLRLEEGLLHDHILQPLSHTQRKKVSTTIQQLEKQELITVDRSVRLTQKGKLYADFVTEKIQSSIL